MKCELCNKKARFKIFKTDEKGKKWIPVCKEHDNIIGAENMKRAGGRYEGK